MLLADARNRLQCAGLAPRHIDAPAFVRLAAALDQVRAVPDLLFVTRHQFQDILPHGAFALVAGPVGTAGGQPGAVFGSNVPDDYLETLRCGGGWCRSPAVQGWLASGEPGFFEWSEHRRSVDPQWLERFGRSGLRNVMACGVRDATGAQAICFNFFRLPGPPQAGHRHGLKLALPHLHHAVLRILHAGSATAQPHDGGAASAVLTPREREVLEWVRRGKTNAEIAAIRGVAHKTVKNQVQSILVKLRVNNRAQAVSSAIERGLI
jgi:DNA-binding CsgD family transcriptional regulator